MSSYSGVSGPASKGVGESLSRTDRDAKNARNESRNEMNAGSEFAPGRSERWRHPEPSGQQPARAAGSSSAAGTGRALNIPGADAFRDAAKLRN